MDGYLIGFCTAGSARISLNLREYELQPNSFFTAAPKHIVQLLEADPDFAVALLVISSSLFSRMNIDTKQLMPLSIEVADPCVVLHASEAQSLCCYVDRIAAELQGTEQRFTFEMISSLMAATMYKLGNVVCNTIKEQPQILTVGSRAKDYFKQFIRVLSRHYRQERSVTFYAERLNITPKYLTTLIKRVSGRSVSEWVDYYVIVEAKTLLKFSDKSIQEISNELNFANQSFFGSYFRRNVGISPSQYRSKQG
ncbi:MAG: helix-turn-helix domain-containing protein [Alistipes sp.]|nr:helix-turn-helix domain-containing protein [Alistipes sp.]MBR3846864.1 helix-turn-helix domain-containing protein [Alistipes sp.]MBR7169379.1 helix-turn-helix domain-containing protein [Alistipes sp.]